MNKILLGIRTTKFDTQTLSLFNYYQSQNIDVVLVVDELNTTVDTGYLPKISINKNVLVKHGLYAEIDKLGWLCGDLGLYLMALAYPNYEGYWFVEDDALIMHNQLIYFLGKPLLDSLDFCAKSLWNAHNTWKWKSAAETYFNIPVAKKCSFGVIFISNKLLFNVLDSRKQYIREFTEKEYEIFLNDESFLSNFSIKNKYLVCELGKLYGEEYFSNYKFSTQNHLNFFNLTLSKVDNGFYHPILIKNNSKDYIDRLIHILKKQKQLGRMYKKQIINQINSNYQEVQKLFIPKILVVLVYDGGGKDVLFALGNSIKARWVEYVIINLTSEVFFIDDNDDNIAVYQVKTLLDGLKIVEANYFNFDGAWVLNHDLVINLDKSMSLVKQLELPERNNCHFGYLQMDNYTNINPFYINFDYLMENDSLEFNNAVKINGLYMKGNFFLNFIE